MSRSLDQCQRQHDLDYSAAVHESASRDGKRSGAAAARRWSFRAVSAARSAPASRSKSIPAIAKDDGAISCEPGAPVYPAFQVTPKCTRRSRVLCAAVVGSVTSIVAPLSALAADPAAGSDPMAGASTRPSAGPAQAPISTSRSNKKHGIDSDSNSAGDQAPPKAPITTSRSN